MTKEEKRNIIKLTLTGVLAVMAHTLIEQLDVAEMEEFDDVKAVVAPACDAVRLALQQLECMRDKIVEGFGGFDDCFES